MVYFALICIYRKLLHDLMVSLLRLAEDPSAKLHEVFSEVRCVMAQLIVLEPNQQLAGRNCQR